VGRDSGGVQTYIYSPRNGKKIKTTVNKTNPTLESTVIHIQTSNFNPFSRISTDFYKKINESSLPIHQESEQNLNQ